MGDQPRKAMTAASMGTFKATMDDLVRGLRATALRDPAEPVLVAGDPEHAAEADGRANGIALHPLVLEMLERHASEFGLAYELEPLIRT
jgi:LDH2 family malate/lactate/ureidoglycolate dehydrogenase